MNKTYFANLYHGNDDVKEGIFVKYAQNYDNL